MDGKSYPAQRTPAPSPAESKKSAAQRQREQKKAEAAILHLIPSMAGMTRVIQQVLAEPWTKFDRFTMRDLAVVKEAGKQLRLVRRKLEEGMQ